ncbi:hypothetical protein MH215_22320 [Paenibacillus sp. ACRSA]|uniref:hypothetical protein n=1 Tax=Paenibacillus sp. ACRSA TaxID=2918211 RepID=UPI001EF3EA26|nr:hypothetical protein [Paenibacillus sp. ACRSA]MCG7379741.1 hypothetical protein [Paenibacillus sp. ACRSA]
MKESNQPFTEQNLANIKRLFYEKVAMNETGTDKPSAVSHDFPTPLTQTRPRRKRVRKAISIPVAAAFSLCLVTGAAASVGIIDLSSVLHFLGEDRLSILKPVHQVSEDQGIRMEVIGAARDGDTTEIYVALTDLTGHRIDDTLDIYDFRVSGGRANNAQVVQYDESKQTAIVRFLIQGKVSAQRITVRINTMMSGAARNDDYSVPVDWDKLLQEKNTTSYDILDRGTDSISGVGGEAGNELWEIGKIPVLHQDVTQIHVEGMDWMHISNIGFIDDQLHIQTNPDKEIGEYNHGHFYFTNEQGKKLDIPEYSISYGHYMRDGVGYGGDYIEYVYDLSALSKAGQLHQLKLKGSFSNITEVLKGNWTTTFDLKKNVIGKVGTTQLIDPDGSQVPISIQLSTIGVTLTGEKLKQIPLDDLRMEIYLKDGSRLTAVSGFISLDQDLIKWISPSTIPVHDVSYLLINGQKVALQDE